MGESDKLRKQRNGKQQPWTFLELKNGLLLFFKENKRYPTAEEFDNFGYLPSARSIQRRFGGLVELRKSLKLSGQHDFTKGEYSSLRAKRINERAYTIEKKVYDYLMGKFGKEFVHREYFFSDDRRARTDFFVYCQNGDFSVDVFYPSNRRNLILCVNNKMKTYGNKLMLQYPVIFLQMNDDLPTVEVRAVVRRKRNKLLPNQEVMCFDEFRDFCDTKIGKRVQNRK